MLRLDNVEVVYSDVVLVLRGISLQVPDKGVVTLLGANGAGKSTSLKAISGLLKTELGEVTDGSITWDGVSLLGKSTQEIASLGIVLVMEGRRIFRYLTVEENLRAAPCQGDSKKDLEKIYGFFPALKNIRNKLSGYCSGGEQQMLVTGRALMLHPKLMLLDEPSLGLAPIVIREILEILKDINMTQGTSILLVEQSAEIALSLSEYGYVMENGRVVMDGPADKLLDNPDIKEFYMGLSAVGEKKSFRMVKHYKRRKRWLS